MAQKILIVEDMASVAEVIQTYLDREGFQVVVAVDGLEALRAVAQQKPDLVILDLILPGLDGLEVCRRIRQDPETAHLPILIVSGKGEEIDRVVGLEVGADDYLTKPFGFKELVARVKALLRRASGPVPSKVLRVGSMEVDLDRYTVRVEERTVSLTAKEFELLKGLLEANGRALSREHLLQTVLGRSARLASNPEQLISIFAVFGRNGVREVVGSSPCESSAISLSRRSSRDGPAVAADGQHVCCDPATWVEAGLSETIPKS